MFLRQILKLLSLVTSMLAVAISVPAFATVVVSKPLNGSTVPATVPFVATASTTTCTKGVSSMGVWVDNKLLYVVDGINLNTTVPMATGKHLAVVQAWDYCGGATSTSVNLTVSTQTGVTVTLPVSGSTVGSPASYVASATTACAKGVAKMGIYVNNVLAYSVAGSTLSTQIPLSVGTQNTVVQEWDNCGGAASTPVSVTTTGTTISNLQANTNWNQWGELPPTYGICTSCTGLSWSMVPHQTAVALDGNSTAFTIGGTAAYADVLWSNPVIGQGNTQGLTDIAHTLIPALHHFTLDQYVYVTNLAATQDLEFDINMFENGVGMEWGTQCNHLADGDWDLWDNVNGTWFSSGIPCNLNNKAWNRVTLQVERESNNDLLYQTIAVNGVTYTIDKTVPPFTVPSGWWGMTVNYQMDGDHKMDTNLTYVDKMNFTYW
jgi:hypothetical protein